MIEKILYNQIVQKDNCINITSRLYSDYKAIKKFLSSYKTINQLAISEGNLDLVCICIDISRAIKECGFNKWQMEKLDLWMNGYSEKYIAEKFEVTNVAIHQFIDGACLKISKNLMR
jgi:hypothetical protein